jgi:site-specific recombinase XerD
LYGPANSAGYYAYLQSGGYSKYTPDDFTSDVKKFTDMLFPYTPRFIEMLLADTAKKAGVQKKVTAGILRDTFVVRSLKRGEGIEVVLKKIGLSEATWEDAKEKYLRLSAGGI